MTNYLEKLDKILSTKPVRLIGEKKPSPSTSTSTSTSPSTSTSTSTSPSTILQSGTTGITWSEHVNKWQVRKYINGKSFNLGLYTDLSNAELALHEFIETGKVPTRKRKQQMGATAPDTLKQKRAKRNRVAHSNYINRRYMQRHSPPPDED